MVRTELRLTRAQSGTHRPIVDRHKLARRALALAGRYRSGCRDLAEDHDQHLDEAFDSLRSAPTRPAGQDDSAEPHDSRVRKRPGTHKYGNL